MTKEKAALILKYGRTALGIAGLILTPALSYLLFEDVTGNLPEIPFSMALLNICWIGVLYLAAFLVSGRSRISIPLISLLLLALSIGEAFVMEFRSRPIMLWDVLAISTAVSVTKNYRFDLSPEMIRAIGLVVFLNLVLFLCPVRLKGKKLRLMAAGAGTAVIAGFVLFFYAWIVPVKDLCLNMWDVSSTYGSLGYMLSTAISVRYLKAEKPQGYSLAEIRKIYEEYSSVEKIQAALDETIRYWAEKVNVTFHTGNPDQDMFMKWVCFQPYLRRIYGCSFLPHHDYGRGGRGWRDLWQDCLSLLLMDPQNVGKMIENNYGGVRIDGTNATIIGNGEGNFIADRNNITRVWMDHALWPLITTQLYIDQTGDIDILNRKVPYFKDAQTERGRLRDQLWSSEQGNKQMTQADVIYKGSILEHLLIQQLSAFYEIGEHNIYRLRDADWNDALDMAPDRGESVAFTCAYAGNLRNLARMIRLLEAYSGQSETELLYEIQILLGHDRALYDSIPRKSEILHKYVKSCRHTISGQRFLISYASLASDLELKAEWLTEHIRNQEWICGQENEGWFNSYYDNHGQAVERYSKKPGDVRMMLTGQVFAIMGQVASPQQIRQIVTSADRYLYRKDIGGYRLNTDFQELKFDMGRMFGFAYGEKENGAVFSHMTVMFAYALYQRGFAREGWKALRTLADTALDFDTSHIYPGIPEYFRSDGRGMYHYLTGAASWFMLTMITQVFGVRGEAGNLLMEPKLTAEQFDETGTASVQLTFAGKEFTVTYINSEHKEYGNYITGSATCNQEYLKIDSPKYTMLSRETIIALPSRNNHIVIHLV